LQAALPEYRRENPWDATCRHRTDTTGSNARDLPSCGEAGSVGNPYRPTSTYRGPGGHELGAHPVSGKRLAEEIERDLVSIVADHLTAYLDEQLPPGRAPIVLSETAVAEVRFKVRDAPRGAEGYPTAIVILREERTIAESNRPSEYWYGLAEKLGESDWLYDGYHCHDEPGRGRIAHLQSELRRGPEEFRELLEWSPLPGRVHVVTAVGELLRRYYERHALVEPETEAD
jgi:hypothetical protein